MGLNPQQSSSGLNPQASGSGWHTNPQQTGSGWNANPQQTGSGWNANPQQTGSGWNANPQQTGSGWNANPEAPAETRDMASIPTVQQTGPRQSFETRPGPPLANDTGTQNAFGPDTAGELRPPTDLSVSSAPDQGKGYELSTADKIVLLISFFVPGAAHIAFGQTKKGILLVASIVLTFGLVYLISIGLVFDAYLVLRAKSYREVDEFEMLPDLKEVLG